MNRFGNIGFEDLVIDNKISYEKFKRLGITRAKTRLRSTGEEVTVVQRTHSSPAKNRGHVMLLLVLDADGNTIGNMHFSWKDKEELEGFRRYMYEEMTK